MSDFLAIAQSWLDTVRAEHLATTDTLVYRRSGKPDLDLTGRGVVVARGQEVIDTENVMALDVETIEYLIPSEILDWGVGPFEPKPGDQILHEFPSGFSCVFELVPYAGLPPARWHNQTRTTYRITAQQIQVI